ncbi:MAG: alpha/beta hydrolase [archaeon]
MTTLLLAHRWSGSPDADWYPWLKRQLEAEGVRVLIPKMPDVHHPKIESWVSTLQETLPTPNEKTYLIGHSIGCQAVLRYIETLPANPTVGGLLLIAPWTKLKNQEEETPEERAIAKPWMETPINWKKIFARATNTRAIFSTDDPYVDYVSESNNFRQKLNANILIEENMGHFTSHDGINELKIARDIIQEWGIFPEKGFAGKKKNSISDE